MVQGTGSHVGKSILVAGIARALARRGLEVAPFKPQNMSNNAATVPGGEIGRAQALQARAAMAAPSVHMNPVLLKPESDTGAQVIVHGQRWATLKAADYAREKPKLLQKVMESFAIVAGDADVVLVEGAGSPAEVNLRAGDIANMGFAEAADVPVVLVGDIDRGGVIASLVGTHAVLPEGERDRIKGFLINKFRGDPGLFDDGLRLIAARSGWPSLGVVLWFADARRLPAEDVLSLEEASPPEPGEGPKPAESCVIAVPRLPRIANFDDLDPLRLEPGVSLRIVAPGEAIPAEACLVIIPGSKSTIADLAFLRAEGWDVDIRAHHRRGGRVLGLCGGYQMLGRKIADPQGFEGRPAVVPGLGLLDVETVIGGDKATVSVAGRHVETGAAVTGYEIHLGRTEGPDCGRPFVDLEGRPDGARSSDGRVAGTYVHGLFAEDAFRAGYLAAFGMAASDTRYEDAVDAALDGLADHLEHHVRIDRLLAIAGLHRSANPSPAAARKSSAQAPR